MNILYKRNKRLVIYMHIAVIAFIFLLNTVSSETTGIYASRKLSDKDLLTTSDYGKVRDTMSDTWVAVDDLGRTVSIGGEVRNVQEEKHVLMFYYTWHGSHTQEIYNIAEILKKAESTGVYDWGEVGDFHYWDEPYFGYYRSEDRWVIRKDIQMLCDAGIDGVFFDASNCVFYHDAYVAFIEENLARKKEGQAYLKCTWLIRAGDCSERLRILYDTYFTNENYKDAFYMIDGKPLMLCPESAPVDEFANYFEVRDCWAWESGEGKWPWLENYPQVGGWGKGKTMPEMVSVSAAQHPTTNIGKSYSNLSQPDLSKQTPEVGLYFSEQWRGALKIDPQFVLVTQWNEWIAQRAVTKTKNFFAGKRLEAGDSYFVDAYSAEYSRDIAPVKGNYGDNYYYLLTSYIRQFKGARNIPTYYRQKTVDISDFSQIRNSESVFYDDMYDTKHRDHAGLGGLHYTDDSGRNDFEEIKVESDDKNIYFYVKTVDNITLPENTNWMNLLINADADYKTGWHGYDFIINRNINGNKTSVERFGAEGKYEFIYAGEADINYKGKEMIISVPKKVIGITSEKFTVDFKFADNIPEEDNIMLFIDKGDTAPNGRFNYRYIFDPDAKPDYFYIIIISVSASIIAAAVVAAVIVINKKKSKGALK